MPMEIGKVKDFSNHEFSMPQSNQYKLIRSRNENDHFGKKFKIKTNHFCKIEGGHENIISYLLKNQREILINFLLTRNCDV